MSMRSFRRGIAITGAYLAIIIGIFVLQFRTDSTIIEKIGSLQVTLEKQDSGSENADLQNKLIASYNGLNFFTDDQNSAKVVLKGKTKPVDIILKNYEKKAGESITFYFSNEIIVSFVLSGTSADSSLSILAEVPDSVETLYFPYSFARNMNIQRDDGNRVILNGKNYNWSFTTNEVKDGFICFTSADSSAHYAVFDDTKKFTFDSITELAIADDAVYEKTLTGFKNSVVSNFRAVLSDNNFTESLAVAYVATMGERGRYTQALEEIPSAFKKSEKRTYVSSPYFNNLAKLNSSLDQDVRTHEGDITKAINDNDVSILMTQNIAAYLCIYPDPEGVKQLLSYCATLDMSTLSLNYVTGILKSYVELYGYNRELADILHPAVNGCIEKITDACTYENEMLTMKENDQFLSVIQAVDIGVALIRYGKVSGQSVYVKAGQVIVNTYINENTSYDVKTINILYPIFAYDNWYYPHFKIIKADPSDLIWAWTCAKEITYSQTQETGLTLNVDFPEGQIHHVIFKGIPKFNAIYIYNMAYRTDPRFETYNSSGYVYRDEGYTLLLKSKQKQEVEAVQMTYPNGVAPRKEVRRPARADSSSSSSSSASSSTETTSATTAPQTKYKVTLEICDSSSKRTVVAAIREIRKDLSGTEANNIFISAPLVLKEDLTSAQADEIIQKITDAGGNATKKKQ